MKTKILETLEACRSCRTGHGGHAITSLGSDMDLTRPGLVPINGFKDSLHLIIIKWHLQFPHHLSGWSHAETKASHVHHGAADWGFDLFVGTQVNHATSLRNFIEAFLQLCLVRSSAELWCSGSSMAVFHASHPNCFQWFIKVHSKLHPLRYFHMQPGYQNCQPKPPIQTIDHWWPLVDNADSMFASAVVQKWRLHQWMQAHVPVDDKLWDFDLFLC